MNEFKIGDILTHKYLDIIYIVIKHPESTCLQSMIEVTRETKLMSLLYFKDTFNKLIDYEI